MVIRKSLQIPIVVKKSGVLLAGGQNDARDWPGTGIKRRLPTAHIRRQRYQVVSCCLAPRTKTSRSDTQTCSEQLSTGATSVRNSCIILVGILVLRDVNTARGRPADVFHTSIKLLPLCLKSTSERSSAENWKESLTLTCTRTCTRSGTAMYSSIATCCVA